MRTQKQSLISSTLSGIVFTKRTSQFLSISLRLKLLLICWGILEIKFHCTIKLKQCSSGRSCIRIRCVHLYELAFFGLSPVLQFWIAATSTRGLINQPLPCFQAFYAISAVVQWLRWPFSAAVEVLLAGHMVATDSDASTQLCVKFAIILVTCFYLLRNSDNISNFQPPPFLPGQNIVISIVRFRQVVSQIETNWTPNDTLLCGFCPKYRSDHMALSH